MTDFIVVENEKIVRNSKRIVAQKNNRFFSFNFFSKNDRFVFRKNYRF